MRRHSAAHLTLLVGCTLLFAACGGDGARDHRASDGGNVDGGDVDGGDADDGGGDNGEGDCDDCDDPACSGAPSCQPSCGNEEVEAGEACDDGNQVDGDGCAADCSRLEICGDGTIDTGEDCDDGNADDSDGCSMGCATELGFKCSGAPSVCNQAPVAVDDEASADEDDLVALSVATLLANDTDREDDTLSLVEVQSAVHGVASFTPGDANVVLTLEAGFSGTASFEYVVSDGTSTDIGLVTVTVLPVDDPPIAAEDMATVDEDTTLSISVATLLENDTLVENGPLAIEGVQNAVHGTVSFTPGDDDVVFTPHADYFGAASFEYVLSDGVSIDVGLVNISVTGVNDAPVNTVPAAQVTALPTAKVFSSANNNALTITDIDAGLSPVRVRLTVTDGTVTLGSTAGLTFVDGDGTDDATTAFTGTIADINVALNGTSVTPDADFAGEMELTLTTNDQGNTGNDGARSDTDVVTIEVRTGKLVEISARFAHACGRTAEGTVYCWGSDSSGQLGNGAGVQSSQVPTQVVGEDGIGVLQDVTQIAAGSSHTCALTSAGGVFCWGANGGNQLGNWGGTSHTPVRVIGPGGTGFLEDVVQISAGEFFTCAVTSDGAAYCWGADVVGELGNGSAGGSAAPARVVGVGGTGVLSDVTQIAAGTFHACAVTSAGHVFCWGADAVEQLGDGLGDGEPSESPVQVLGEDGSGVLENVKQISAYNHTCAVTGSGSAYCWGEGGPKLGSGGSSARPLPTRVVGNLGFGSLGDVQQISAGAYHTCAIASFGSFTGVGFCWGFDDHGALGNGNNGTQEAPFRLSVPLAEESLSQITASFQYSCAVTSSGDPYCWGSDSSGALGNGGTSDEDSEFPSPMLMPGTSEANVAFTQISSGNAHTCGVVAGGAAYCWGNDGGGRLGNGSPVSNSQLPVRVVGPSGAGFLSPVVQIDAADTHTCALTGAGSAYCWGDDDFGQLGNGAAGSSPTPVQVVGVGGTSFLSNVANIDTGMWHTCAAIRDGRAFCWGNDGVGQLGNDDGGDSQTPTQVRGVDGAGFLANVKQIGVGDAPRCAVTSDGNVYCWGGGTSETPTRVRGVGGTGFLENVTQIAIGPSYSCALTGSGSVYCWGSDASGTLGNGGGSSSSSTPVQVIGGEQGGATLANVTQLSARRTLACATTSTGNVFCWGSDSDGQLGDGGTSTNSQSPVQVAGVGGVDVASAITQVAAGDKHGCAISSAGSAFCWGLDDSGQLGNGGGSTSTQAPAEVTAPVE